MDYLLRTLRYYFIGCILCSLPAHSNTQDSFQPKNGLLDLSNWSAEIHGPIALRGEWYFFWERLLAPDQIESAIANAEFNTIIPVPGDWAEAGFSNFGYATYVLKLTGISSKNKTLGIKIGQFNPNYNLYIVDPNSRQTQTPLITVGHVSDSYETSKWQSKPALEELSFEPNAKDIYIVFQTSSFLMSSGFGSDPITIGNYSQLKRQDELSLWQSIFVLGMLFLISLSNFALFVQRREDKASLYIACFSLLMGVRYVATEGLLGRIFPEPSDTIYLMTSLTLATALPIGVNIFLGFLSHSFPKYFNRKFIQIGWAIIALYTLQAVLFSQTVQYTMGPVHLISLIFGIYLQYCLLRARFNHERGSQMALVGIAILIFGFANDTFVYLQISPLPYLAHYTLVAFVFIQSLIVGRNFAFAFRTAEHLSLELQKEVDRQTRDIKTILNHIHQGIFTINGDDKVVGDDHSKFLESILGVQEISGKSAIDLVFTRSNLSQEEKSMVNTVLDFSIGESSFAFESNEDALVHEMTYMDYQNTEKHLKIEWSPVINEKTDLIEKVLVTLRDVTELKKLEAQAAEQQRYMQLIEEIIEIPAEKFASFLNSAKKFLAENTRLISVAKEPDHANLKILFINMHTIKGAARGYRLKEMTEMLHDAEHYYASLQKGEEPWNQQRLQEDIDRITKLFDEYETIWRDKLGRGKQENSFEIDLDSLRANVQALQELEKELAFDDRLTPFVNQVRSTLYNLYFQDVRELFKSLMEDLPRLAKDLGKDQPTVSLQTQDIGLTQEGTELLENIFVHILRNSMDHGIETPVVRESKGKHRTGNIQIDFQEVETELQILYQDDGAGLNVERIKKIGLSQGLIEESKIYNQQDISELIFHSGLSTSGRLSDVSGRGVGMDAVRKYLERMGGSIGIELLRDEPIDGGIPFSLIIKLPSNLFKRIDPEVRKTG